MSFVLRALTPGDFPAVDPLLMAAYDSPTSMLDDLARYQRLQPDGWILALRDGRPVGLGGALLYGTHARIGLMAVQPAIQHQGVGTALLRELLAWIANRGATTVALDATAEGAPLYARFGFIPIDTVYAYLPGSLARPPEHPTEATARLEPEELAALIRYDEGRSGIERSRMLTAYYAEFPDRTFVVHTAQGEIAGYFIAQNRRLGPWIADTPEIAAALLQCVLHLPFPTSPMALVPAHNQAAQLLLENAGFLPERHWQAMHLGSPPDLRSRQWLYGYTNFYCG